MTEIKPYMCSCCNDIWNRVNQKNINLGKYELHLCPDCYREYIISNNKVLDKIRAEIQGLRNCSCSCSDGIIDDVEDILDKYKAESGEE